MATTDTVVELEGVNGEMFNLTTGDQGIFLATGVKGLFDPPVKTVYEEPGNYPGARYLNHRILRRDLVFGVEILNDSKDGADKSWLSRDSKWRKAWAFDRDCKLRITTPESGTRYLKVRLGEAMDISTVTDPNGNTINRAGMVCISGDPFWYEDDAVFSATTLTDTTFDPNPLPWPWPQEALPTETLTITVDAGDGGLNPTDQDVYPIWQAPGSTEAPSELYVPGVPWLGAPNSPATIWTIPDYSFGQEVPDNPSDDSNRRLRMPGLIGGLRTNEVQVVDITGSPTSGDMVWTFDSQPTGNIAFDASESTAQTALEALSNIAPGDVAVVKSTLTLNGASVTRFKITFQGAYEGQNVPLLSVTNTFGGGTTPWATPKIVTEGNTAPAENVTIDTDPRVEQVESESNSPVWQRMNGVRFRYPFPAWTESCTFEITVSGCIPGQMITLRIPRPWTRPWGLE